MSIFWQINSPPRYLYPFVRFLLPRELFPVLSPPLLCALVLHLAGFVPLHLL